MYIRLGALTLHPHRMFEVLAYLVGTRLYLALTARWTVVAAAVVGCAIGSKLLYWLSDPAVMLEHGRDPIFLLGGKSIVGGLIGGLIAVEWIKISTCCQ